MAARWGSMSGVVYTKAWVVRLMLDMVGYVESSELAHRVAIEPSCGCGAFLSEMVKRLVASAKSRGEFTRRNLENSLRAYDVDVVAVEKSRQLVMSLLRESGMPEVDSEELASTWVNEGDTLLVNLPQADWVIGNPPYVRSNQIDRAKRAEYAERLECVTMGTDLYVGFYESGLRALKEDGKLCFICSDRWLQNRYGSRLRVMIDDGFSVSSHVRMHGADVFEDEVSAYPAITVISRGRSDLCYVDCAEDFSESDAGQLLDCIDRSEYEAPRFGLVRMARHDGGGAFPLASPRRLRAVSMLSAKFPLLEEAGIKVGIGMASGCDEVFITDDESVVEHDRLLPLFYMRDCRNGLSQTRYLVNPWNDDGNLVDLDEYPKLKFYFAEHRDALHRRHIVETHPSEWYRTLDKPKWSLIGRPMLLFPDMAARSDPVLSDGTRYPHHNCYWMTSDSWNLEALGGLLMSDVVEAFIDAYGVKMRGKTLRFQAQYLRKVHVPHFEDIDVDVVGALADAFRRRDRAAASMAARKAYGMEGEAL